MMEISLATPPVDHSYFNVCYNYTELGEVATYLKEKGHEVEVLDYSVYGPEKWDEYLEGIEQDRELTILWNRFGNLVEIKKSVDAIKNNDEKAKVVTYGQPSSWIPRHFQKYGFDAIAADVWEISLASYAGFLEGDIKESELEGVIFQREGDFFRSKRASIPETPFWTFADLKLLPLDEYFRIYAEEQNIAGISDRELGLSLSRGCAGGCKFCNVPKIHGRKDVRKPVAEVMRYIDDSFERFEFEMVSLFSPILTNDRGYMEQFCKEAGKRELAWKGVTPLNKVDPELLYLMGEGGCKRLGFGLETLNSDAQSHINKYSNREKISEVVKWCDSANIEPLMFLMAGIPGETKESLIETGKFLKALGAKVRVTAYTPYHQLRDEMSMEEVNNYDRRNVSFENVRGVPREEFARIVDNFDGWLASKGASESILEGKKQVEGFLQ